MRDIPDCLEGDQAASDLVWADFHDIDLAGDSDLVSKDVKNIMLNDLLEDAYACAVAELGDGLDNKVSTCVVIAVRYYSTYPYSRCFGRIQQRAALYINVSSFHILLYI